MVDFKDRPEFLRGRSGERVVADWLQARGWWIVPSYDYSGEDDNKAPKLQGLDEGLVIPDLDIARHGKRMWAEVKTKAAATFYRKLQRDEHGINRRLWCHYHRVQEITGTHVWVFVVEETTQMLLAESLDILDRDKREYDGGKMGRGGMVFWPRSSFRLQTKLAAKAA